MRWIRALPVAVIAILAAGCGDGGSAGGGPDGGGNPLSCDPTVLFAPRTLGESGIEVIGYIRQEPSSGDLYFSTGVDLYVLRAGSDEPTLLSPRPDDIWGEFWLLDDRLLLPSGFQVPLVDTEIAVLFTMPREGGEPEVQVAAPVSDEFGWSYEIGSVEVAGDYVYWVGRDRFNDTTMPLGGETTSYVRRTLWQSPGQPEELYSSEHSLARIIVAGGYVFVTEENREDTSNITSTQVIIDAGTGEPLPMTSEERYGGEVVAGDADSLLVTRSNTAELDQFGSWHVSPDGESETKLGDVFLFGAFGPTTAISRDGFWAFTNVDPNYVMHVYTYSDDSGLRDIGCYDADDSTFGIEIADDRVVVPTFNANNESSLIAFDL